MRDGVIAAFAVAPQLPPPPPPPPLLSGRTRPPSLLRYPPQTCSSMRTTRCGQLPRLSCLAEGGASRRQACRPLHPPLLVQKRPPTLPLPPSASRQVDWYPWGEEAFEKARKEDKPIFLSVGYSTCHWCGRSTLFYRLV